MTWWWTRVYADDTTLSLSQCIQGCDLCVHWDNCAQKCQQFCEQLNRNTLTTGETTKGNCTKLCVLAHAGNLQFRFQQGPFTKRFRTVVTRVPAVVLSISRFSRLAVTRAWLFALNELRTEETVTYSHFGPRPLRMSWLTCCCCIAVIACGIGLFHMARASSRLASVQINTTKQCWLRSCSVFTAPQGAHTSWKCAYVFTQPYSPREESFPIPLKYIDVSRTTHTNLDVMQESRIDDYWNIDESRDLSDSWTGFTQFTLLSEKPPEGCIWSRRLTKRQATSRLDH